MLIYILNLIYIKIFIEKSLYLEIYLLCLDLKYNDFIYNRTTQ